MFFELLGSWAISPFFSPLHRTEGAALNKSFSCYWAPFAVCGAASREVAGPCAPSIASCSLSELRCGFTPPEAAVSTSADTTAPPSPDVSNQALRLQQHVITLWLKCLMWKEVGWLSSIFVCLPSVENSVHAQHCTSFAVNTQPSMWHFWCEEWRKKIMWEMSSNIQANTPDAAVNRLPFEYL